VVQWASNSGAVMHRDVFEDHHVVNSPIDHIYDCIIMNLLHAEEISNAGVYPFSRNDQSHKKGPQEYLTSFSLASTDLSPLTDTSMADFKSCLTGSSFHLPKAHQDGTKSFRPPVTTNDDLMLLNNDELRQLVAQERSKNLALKQKIHSLQESNAKLSMRGEVEVECIVNRLIKNLSDLKNEKATLMIQLEQEEELMTNKLQRKLRHVLEEKAEIENQLEAEQEYIVNRLNKQLSESRSEKVRLEAQLTAEKLSSDRLLQHLGKEEENIIMRLQNELDNLKKGRSLNVPPAEQDDE